MLPRLPELAREVAEIANGVVAAARGAGRDDLAELLVQAAGRWSLPGTTVAVVGESGVGKTALVNALVGRAALPTRDLVSRSTLATVRPAAEPSVTARGSSSQVPLELEPGAIATWLEAQGPVSDGVTSLDVAVVDPATGPATTLVDTPGVSPAGSGRGRAVVTALQCDVLLFVSDPDSPLTRPELDLLAEARGTAGAVLVVLNRVDRFRGWAQVRDADLELLAAELPGAPVQVLPVSSSLAAAALELRGRDDGQADALEEESGVPAARQALAQLTQRTREVRLLGLLRLACQVGAEVEADAAQRTAGAALDAQQAAAEADRLQAELDALRERAQEVLVSLGDETGRLRDSLLVELKRAGTAALAARDEARQSRRPDADDEVQLLDDLDAAREDLEASVAERTEALAAWLLDQLTGSAGSSPVSSLVPKAGPSSSEATDRSLRLRFAAALLSGGSGAVLLGTMFMPELSGSLRPTLMSLGMMSGSMSALAALRHTGRQRSAGVRKAAAKALVDEWQAVTISALRADLVTSQRRTEAALKKAVGEAVQDLTARVAALRGQAAGHGAGGTVADGRALRAHLTRATELVGLLQASA